MNSRESKEDQLINYFLKGELRVINSSIPRRRKTLEELLKEEYPYVLTRDGGTHMFRRSELELAKELIQEKVSELLLPIYLELRPDLSETVAVVSDPVAIELISKLIKIEKTRPLYLYPIQLSELRRRASTLFIYLISPRSLTQL
jgi:uncharacterized protein (UPF0216 family)